MCILYTKNRVNLKINIILQVIAEETETNPKLSSTATLTITITDTNDNKPIFDQESYSVTVSGKFIFLYIVYMIEFQKKFKDSYIIKGILRFFFPYEMRYLV